MAACFHLLILLAAIPLPIEGLVARRGPEADETDAALERLFAHMEEKEGDLGEQAAACSKLAGLVKLTQDEWQHIRPSPHQAKAMHLGFDVLAVAAMRRFPRETSVLRNCSFALKELAQWNAPAFAVLGEHGAVEATAEAVQRFPDDPDMLSLVGNLAALTDFERNPDSQRNLGRLEKTGLARTVIASMRKFANNSNIILAGLCFFSNACTPPALNAQLIEAGYLEDSVAIMRWGSRKFGIRGEVVWVADKCFSRDAEHRRRQADAGLLEQVVATLSDANRGLRTDVINNGRMFRNAVHLLGRFAEASGAHRGRILEAGAEREIRAGIAGGLTAPRDACPCLQALGLSASLPAECAAVEH